jgi:hypothetical protein
MTNPEDAIAPEKKPEPEANRLGADTHNGSVATPARAGGDALHDNGGGESFESHDEALRSAAGLEGDGGRNSRYSISEFGQNIGQGEGVSRGQIVKYSDTQGNVIQGGQYSNKEGTFFKTPEGSTYKVQLENNQYTLQPTKPGQQPIEASQRDVVSNGFSQFSNPSRETPEKIVTPDKVSDKPDVAAPRSDASTLVQPRGGTADGGAPVHLDKIANADNSNNSRGATGQEVTRVETSVNGVVLKGGQNPEQIPGGDSFRPDPGARALAHQGLDAKEIALGDRITIGQDLKQVQPILDAQRARQPGDGNNPGGPQGRLPGDGKDNPGNALVGRPLAEGKDTPVNSVIARIPGSDQSPGMVPTQRIPGLDLRDPQTKAFLADALRQIQATKIGDFDPRNQSQNLQDILKGFDPHKVERLQAFLNPDGKGPISDAAVGRLASILTQGNERTTSSAATDLSLGQRTAMERLTDLVRGNQQNALSLRDMIGRSLDGTKSGERGLGPEGRSPLDRPTTLDPLSFIARMTPAQELAIRTLLEARLTGDHLGKVDPRLADLTGKFEPGTRTENRVDLVNKVEHKFEVGAKELSGKPEHTGKPELPGRQELSGKELGIKSELSPKGELTGMRQDIARSDQIIRPPELKDDRNEKADGLPFTKHDHTILDVDGSKKTLEEKEAAKHKEEQDRWAAEEQKRKESALMALIADRKLREDKEKQQKEQEKIQEKKKDEDDRRIRYVVRERDTLESIASKQLKDGKLGALIFEINRKEISLKVEHGREVADLRARQVIWLPSGVDIREFRKRLYSGSVPQSANDSKLTAEDELAARFGSNWSGADSGADTVFSGSGSPVAPPEVSPEEVAATQTRRTNIESLLGPLSKPIAADGRIRYVVRLGDTLKSVSMKHPSLQDISLWQLVAELNEIPVDTDEKGIPQAKLSRGSTLLIPSLDDIQQFRDRTGIKPRTVEKVTKACPHCGRLSALGASICGACAHSFSLDAKPHVAPNDAGMVVMQAAGFVNKPGVPLTKRPMMTGEHAEVEQAAPVIPQPLYDQNAQLAVVTLDEQTRLARCIVHGEAPCTVFVIEVTQDNAWKAVVAYEIFPQNALRHEYNPRGERKTVRIELPTEASLELSNNDLSANWKNYRDRYFAQLITLNR